MRLNQWHLKKNQMKWVKLNDEQFIQMNYEIHFKPHYF